MTHKLHHKNRQLILSLLLTLMMIPLTGRAQGAANERVKVDAVYLDPNDLTAQRNPVKDLNGDPTALIIINVMTDDLTFAGDTVKVNKGVNEYRVYMPGGTKYLTIASSKFKPHRFFFPDYNISQLDPGCVYKIDLTMPSTQTYIVTIRVLPVEATVLIDDKKVDNVDGVAMKLCEIGKHTYTVEAPGYESATNQFTVTDKKVVMNVRLKAVGAVKVSPFRGPNGKMGFRDQNNKTVVKPEFDKVMPSGNLFWVTKAGKFGMVDEQGTILAKCTYDNVLTSKVSGLFIVSKDGKYGVVNSTGWETIPCMLDKVSTTSADVMVGVMDGLFGLISRDGNLVIPCVNEEITDFHDGLAGIRRDGKCGFINTDGDVVIDLIYDGVSHFSGGIARVMRDGGQEYIDKQGKPVDPRISHMLE